jgi:hypothetical protein
MGRPHTIIGAERFHFRVRDGIGWFSLAMAARQTVRYFDTVAYDGGDLVGIANSEEH